MGKSREIKNRMKAVGNIKRITRTMQMIATSKFAKAQQAALGPKPYTRALFDLVAQLASGEAAHPLLARPADASAPELTLLITSDRGLCGPYNGSLIRTALKHLRDTPAAMAGPVEVVGKKGVNVLRFSGVPIATHHTQFGDKPDYDAVRRLADGFVERYLAGEISAVRVVYMRYISAGRQAPEVLQLLPLEPPAAEGAPRTTNAVYEFSPSADELLDALIPAAVRSLLFQAFNDAIVSEHVARMVAMKSATDNAGKMGQRLKRQYNRARQAQITTELTEIISGAAALG